MATTRPPWFPWKTWSHQIPRPPLPQVINNDWSPTRQRGHMACSLNTRSALILRIERRLGRSQEKHPTASHWLRNVKNTAKIGREVANSTWKEFFFFNKKHLEQWLKDFFPEKRLKPLEVFLFLAMLFDSSHSLPAISLLQISRDYDPKPMLKMSPFLYNYMNERWIHQPFIFHFGNSKTYKNK